MKATELRNALGAEGFSSLIEHFAGDRIYIPKSVPEDHFLKKLPNEVLSTLIREFCGSTINVPTKNIYERNEEITQKFFQGKSYRQLALDYSLTERWISEIVNSPTKSKQFAS